jgi:light-regulated signal transduction histidine kinase (bacteriophytochrome)
MPTVRRNENLRDDSAHLLTLIDPATSGMERLIDSLLRYAHAGQGQLNRERVKTDQIIEGVRTTLAHLITKTRARIVCGPLPAVDADPVLRNWGSRILFLTRSCITAPVLPTIRIGFLNR